MPTPRAVKELSEGTQEGRGLEMGMHISCLSTMAREATAAHVFVKAAVSPCSPSRSILSLYR